LAAGVEQRVIIGEEKAKMTTAVVTRSYDVARTAANIEEKILTPPRVGSNLLRKLFSAVFDDDLRLEAQPLYAPGAHVG
jgi:hypothetical protein